MRTTVYISWKNNLGGFDYWPFYAYHDEGINILESWQAEENIFPDWPNSYGEFADTVTKQTYRSSKRTFVIRSQYVSQLRLSALKYIKVSPLVQVLTTRYDRRTVIVDTDSFTVIRGRDKLFAIQFTITYTDFLPSQ